MEAVAVSRAGVPIRLPEERWLHILTEHPELAGLSRHIIGAIAEAERVLRGQAGELLAIKTIEPGKAIVVVHREASPDDGFVITAFVTRRFRSLNKREQVWPPR